MRRTVCQANARTKMADTVRRTFRSLNDIVRPLSVRRTVCQANARTKMADTVRRTFRSLYDIVFLLTGQHGLNVRQRLVKIGLHAALHALLISICNGDQIRFAQEITDDGQTGWLPIFR